MISSSTLSNLAGVLADIYPDESSIRRVVTQAGLAANRIAFDPRAINTWNAVLTEASLQGKVPNIVEIAVGEYPRYEPLRSAVAGLDTHAPKSTVVPPPSQPLVLPPGATSPRRPTEDEKRALAQALLQCEAMSNHTVRAVVIGCLPAQIRQRIRYGPNDLIDVLNIVNTAANFVNGLRELVDCVRLIEGPTYAMQEVDRQVAPFV